MTVRSNNLVFGRDIETVPQTKQALTGPNFSRRIYAPDIKFPTSVNVVNPVGLSNRPTHTSRGQKVVDVTYQTELIRASADGTAPAFFTELLAAGWSVGSGANADVATFGDDSDNTHSLTCELWDGIDIRSAWGVRGNIEIGAGKPTDILMLTYTGKGHGSKADQTAGVWPSGITLDAIQGAILEACTLSIGGYSPELESFKFSSTGDQTVLGNGAGGLDGFSEVWNANQQFKLALGIWMNSRADKDWLSYLDDAGPGLSQALAFTVPLGGSLALSLTGDLLLTTAPNRGESGGIGTYPLEFTFSRNSNIVLSQITVP